MLAWSCGPRPTQRLGRPVGRRKHTPTSPCACGCIILMICDVNLWSRIYVTWPLPNERLTVHRRAQQIYRHWWIITRGTQATQTEKHRLQFSISWSHLFVTTCRPARTISTCISRHNYIILRIRSLTPASRFPASPSSTSPVKFWYFVTLTWVCKLV